MKKLLTVAALLTTLSIAAKADSPFVSNLFAQKCAVLNEDLNEYGEDYETHVEGMLMGFLSAYSIAIFSDNELARYIPDVEGTAPLFTQVVFKHCKDNPADNVLDGAAQSMVILAKDKS